MKNPFISSQDFYAELRKLIPGLPPDAKEVTIRLSPRELAIIEVTTFIRSEGKLVVEDGQVKVETKTYELKEKQEVNHARNQTEG